MIRTYRRYRLRIANVLYWFLLLYIVSGFIWWYISLRRQSSDMTRYELSNVRATVDSLHTPFQYIVAVHEVYRRQDLRSVKYIGEGGTFLIVILFGALFIYRVVGRQIRLSDLQQYFMMAVTHEIKTPIAVAKLNLETLLLRQLDETQRQKLIRGALLEMERLNQLSSNILLASQLEESAYQAAQEPVPFSDLAVGSVDDFRARFGNRTILKNIQPGIILSGDALLLELAVNNLLENALKYSPQERPVHVTLKKESRNIQLRVADLGSGIPDREKSLIFRKFYRVGDEHTRRTKGTGLGLYLTRKIIHLHRGVLTVQDNKPQGSIFTMAFHTGRHGNSA